MAIIEWVELNTFDFPVKPPVEAQPPPPEEAAQGEAQAHPPVETPQGEAQTLPPVEAAQGEAAPQLPVLFPTPWLMALADIGDVTHLKIVGNGSWEVMAGLTGCGPDGLLGYAVPDTMLLLKDCPLGALIGRIGGSSATLGTTVATDSGESAPFAIGSHCVVKLPAHATGPLFVGFNIMRRPVKVTTLKVKIYGAKPVFAA